jgi:hypothetical protein
MMPGGRTRRECCAVQVACRRAGRGVAVPLRLLYAHRRSIVSRHDHGARQRPVRHKPKQSNAVSRASGSDTSNGSNLPMVVRALDRTRAITELAKRVRSGRADKECHRIAVQQVAEAGGGALDRLAGDHVGPVVGAVRQREHRVGPATPCGQPQR